MCCYNRSLLQIITFSGSRDGGLRVLYGSRTRPAGGKMVPEPQRVCFACVYLCMCFNSSLCCFEIVLLYCLVLYCWPKINYHIRQWLFDVASQRDSNAAQKHNLRLGLVDCGGIRMDDANTHGSVDSRTASCPGRPKSKPFLRHIPASGTEDYFALCQRCVKTESDG